MQGFFWRHAFMLCQTISDRESVWVCKFNFHRENAQPYDHDEGTPNTKNINLEYPA